MAGRVNRAHYTRETLVSSVRVLEARYSISSAVFYAARLAGEEPTEVPPFEAHVWASLYEDVLRMSAAASDDEDVLAVVGRTYATAG